MAIINSNDIKLFLDGVSIPGQTENVYNINNKLIDTTSKDLGGLSSYIAGVNDAKINLKVNFDSDLMALFFGYVKSKKIFGFEIKVGKLVSGVCFISEFKIDSKLNTKVTADITLQVTGRVYYGNFLTWDKSVIVWNNANKVWNNFTKF